MRRCTLAFIFAFLTCFIVACDGSGLPLAPTPQVPATPSLSSSETGTPVQPTGTAQPTAAPSTAIPTTAPTLTESGATATQPADPTSTAQASNGELSRELAQVEADAAHARGLQPKKDVPETFLTQDQLRANLTKDLAKDYSREEARRDAVELWLRRLIKDRTLDLYQLQIDLLTEQVAGYYDPKKDELFVLGNQQKLDPLSRETLAHEFVHSLQDEYYDLNKLLPDKSHEYDRDMAVRSLVEGDASLAGVMYAYQNMTPQDFQDLMQKSANSSTAVFDKAPQYIRDSLIFPYTKGSDFVGKLVESKGFSRVNDALADPPRSTEQLMHPEKYMSRPRDEPLPVSLPPLTSTLGLGWTYKDGGSTGEFDLLETLQANNGTAPEKAAAGWGGGEYSFYQNGDASLFLMDTRWDTAADATEFDSSMRDTMKGMKQDGAIWSDAERFFALKSSGDHVAYVASTDRKALEAAVSAVK